MLAHLALLAVLMFSLDWSPSPSTARKPAPIQAIAIDARKLDAEVESKKKLEATRQQEKQRAEQARLKREQEKKQLAEEKRKAEAEKKQRVEAAHKQAEVEKKRKAELKKKAETEKKRKAEAVRKKAEAEKKRKAEAVRKKAEAEKKRKMEEARQKAEAEKKRKAEEARQKAEAEMRERLAAEQERLRAQRDSAMQRMIDEYGLYIKEKVQRSWIRPSAGSSSLSCVVNVRLIPGGEVVDVKIVRGSGNAAFDRSVEAAVFKASPLPVPPDPEVMEKFRSITFEFNPDS
ncbi:cell division and transport-associated protein TolA [Thiogranum longum]|uniref:Cell division and transport-associated protein TolA n=1 Tax=Thiogranum longum TaxID=1537524 RepID=A0A4R1HA14_9GAMM|nr:cell envelope integrity protein TolA [Thiogranum longum]TCK17381.1 cell division and transport-associated protein TolA [Thiogranum longum]